MTRYEVAWLIVRGVGAFLLVHVALGIISLILTGAATAMAYEQAMPDPIEQSISYESSVRYLRLKEQLWTLGAQTFLTLLCAYYCLFKGAWLQHLLVSRLPKIKSS